MAGINQDIAFAVTQIRTGFADDIGNSVSGVGTGFFLRTHAGPVVFVTNRHNLDPELNPKALCRLGPSRALRRVELRLREHDSSTQLPKARTEFVALQMTGSPIVHSPDADVSLVVAPAFDNKPQDFGFNSINERELATKEDLQQLTSMADLVTFIGYPGGAGNSPWWDTAWSLPIGRLAGLASRSDLPFSNPAIKTADVTLVSGLSFNGSSGSPVVLHRKHAPAIGSPDRPAPPMVVGLMSGHWWDPESEPSMFRHSGLSYFTRATAIRALFARWRPV